MKSSKYRKTGNKGLFDKEETLNKLTAMGNPLSKLSNTIDFEIFRPELEAAMLTQEKKNNAGAKPIDVILMFKIVLLKRLYNLGDEQAEFQINDRLSFVEVPRQRNTREENELIKSGRGDELWNDHPLFFADSAYTGKTITNLLRRFRIKPRIIDRAYRNKPLTEKQKKNNNTKSKTRCRCEHVFGYVTNSMGDFFTRNIGFERVRGVVGLINLTYNICRYEQIVRLKLLPMQA